MKIIRILLLVQVLLGCEHSSPQSDSQSNLLEDTLSETVLQFEIKPSITDPSITNADTPHLVIYNSNIKQGKLLLFMPGTNGIATKGPIAFFTTAIEQGYRVIGLSYINTPAISQICINDILANCEDCAEKFRQYRIYGDNSFSLIDDKPQDAIVNRLTKLLKYLVEYDKQGNWGMYLENDAPKWDQIALTGQSQGGGMAAFIAQKIMVARVISFSGGWDYSVKGVIAKWYFNPSVTPADRWFGTYNVAEANAEIIDATYRAMGILDNHIYALNVSVPEGQKAHTNGVYNTAYKNTWIEMLGTGN